MAKTLSLNFQRNAKAHLARLKRTKAPMLLTVNGSASVIVQEAGMYQRLVDRVEELEAEQHFIAAVNEGLRDVAEGRTYLAREVMKYRGR
jgi:PHD/YefM family antitoxin component YafN of YafNO toxin-antitoxin module